ncbi:winged helix-turn-helix domain-containing protein [Methylicorpusculum oleiharenae]|uniref:winged helix-turn-helix domain-containing protein n=1 Tax=Methylicorpusculum oleiharenae TaxID=1338687 RepID=UPI001E28D55A|nr:helix-turn-helix domain-containing protein [Methylicorpusculum oleiharenae]MCD2452482.1 winged helix-turn-helix domain-containing protein [Methylicorpusculum oleiharenae]
MNKNNNIIVFDNDRYIFFMLKGYCYANNLSLTELELNVDRINLLKESKPLLIIIPLDFINADNRELERNLLRQICLEYGIKVCGINNRASGVTGRSSPWVDKIVDDSSDIIDIDKCFKELILTKDAEEQERRHRERRSYIERRNRSFNHDNGILKYNYFSSVKSHHVIKHKDNEFEIDHLNKCVFLKGQKIELTRKEYELFELLATDTDRTFMADEIIDHLWPENNRATKSDLYQYMYLLRKKIEIDTNHPQWIITVKGFGYKLNIGHHGEVQKQEMCA